MSMKILFTSEAYRHFLLKGIKEEGSENMLLEKNKNDHVGGYVFAILSASIDLVFLKL